VITQDMIDELQTYGFSEAAIRQELQATKGDMNLAANNLFLRDDDSGTEAEVVQRTDKTDKVDKPAKVDKPDSAARPGTPDATDKSAGATAPAAVAKPVVSLESPGETAVDDVLEAKLELRYQAHPGFQLHIGAMATIIGRDRDA
jgi:hypothetical protein